MRHNVFHSGVRDQVPEVEILVAAQRAKDGKPKIDPGAPGPQQGSCLEQYLRALQPLDAAANTRWNVSAGTPRSARDRERNAGVKVLRSTPGGAMSICSKSAL